MQMAPQVTSSETTNPVADQRLREFAHQLAKTHETFHISLNNVKKSNPRLNLLENLNKWELDLSNANKIFKSIPAKDLAFSRAGEWMLDNFYIVKQTLRQIEKDLPSSFLDQLPKLTETNLEGYPRVFALAHEWVGYTQSQLDLTQTAAFLLTYQEVTPLT